MKLEIEVPDHKIVDQNEYADWYLSRADMERIGEATDGKCRIKDKNGNEGEFDLIGLGIKWDNAVYSYYDMSHLSDSVFDSIEEDFDTANFIWGKNISGAVPANVLFKT